MGLGKGLQGGYNFWKMGQISQILFSFRFNFIQSLFSLSTDRMKGICWKKVRFFFCLTLFKPPCNAKIHSGSMLG